jgi:molybdopterin synthase catalytic subunit
LNLGFLPVAVDSLHDASVHDRKVSVTPHLHVCDRLAQNRERRLGISRLHRLCLLNFLCLRRDDSSAIDTDSARRELVDLGAGGYVSFEGWVRNYNEGQEVIRLEYEAFQELAAKEGERIVAEALQRFPLKHALCIHRIGALDLTDMAVWVGVSSVHRGEAFDACRFIIDEVKHRVPIWKKEHYRSGDSGWVNCERCAAAPIPHQHA